MIKTASIFPRQVALNSAPVLTAIKNSLTKQGVRIVENDMEADAAIIWSVLWTGRMAANRSVYQCYSATNRPVIVIDVGTLMRGITWKIALNNINREGWFGSADTIDPKRVSALGLSLGDKPAGDSILVALQHRRSMQAQAILDWPQWILKTCHHIRRYSDRPIVVRPHPRDFFALSNLPDQVTLQRPRALPGTYDDFDWSCGWHAVINHNSGPGVLAAIAGCRPVVHESSLAWPVAVNIPDIESPYIMDRHEWFIEIANTEYTLEEIDQGLWLKRLGSRL